MLLGGGVCPQRFNTVKQARSVADVVSMAWITIAIHIIMFNTAFLIFRTVNSMFLRLLPRDLIYVDAIAERGSM